MVSADHVSSGGDSDLRSLIRSTDAPVIVGGCVSYHAALHLMRTGAAGVIVGGGRPELGLDVPLATINTAALITSSVTMVMAWASLARRRYNTFRLWMWATVALGGVLSRGSSRR